MGNSLEVRTPFLDFNLVNYMFSVESKIKVGDTNKYLLKKDCFKIYSK
jgi:asparagine synthase (glutamine-hydrolysing)